jgi:hypothetical protein
VEGSPPWLRLLKAGGLFLLVIASVGWVAPAFLALEFHFTAVEQMLDPAEGLHSFPYRAESHRMLRWAAVWLTAVVIVWSGFGAWTLWKK